MFKIRNGLLMLALIVMVGCQGSGEKPKADASRKWNAARAAVLYSLGKQQFEGGNIDAARSSVQQAITLDEGNVSVRLLSARIALEQNQLELAERELDAARASAPTNAEADYLSGVVYQRWQRLETALKFYDSAGEKAPGELAYLLARAEMLVVLDRADEARRILGEKLDYFEHSGALRDALGQLLMQHGEVAQGVELLRQASIMASQDTDIAEHLAMALCFAGQYHEAEPIVRRLLQLPANDGSAQLHLALGECRLNAGDERGARDSFQRAAELNANLGTAWLGLARVAIQSGDSSRALLALRKAIHADPSNSQSHLLLGYVQLQCGQTSDAATAFKRALALNPRDTVSLCMIGYLLERQGDNDQALRYYARALKINPHDELATRLMAWSGASR